MQSMGNRAPSNYRGKQKLRYRMAKGGVGTKKKINCQGRRWCEEVSTGGEGDSRGAVMGREDVVSAVWGFCTGCRVGM